MESLDYDRGKAMSDRIGWVLTIGLFSLMAFSTLAFGTVEPWSVAFFGTFVTALLLLWAIKAVVERRFVFRAPAVILPLLALLMYGTVQSLSFTDGAGQRRAISMDVEATRLALELVAALLIAALITANLLGDRKKLIWFGNFLIFFGLAVSVFGLIQRFTWNGNYYWVIEPSVPPASPFGPFVNHNHFAGYIEMIVPLPVALVLTRAVRGEKSLFYGFAAAIMGMATIVSLSRGGMVSLISGVMVVVIFGFRLPAARINFSERRRFPLLLSRIAATSVIILTITAGVWWVGADSVIRRVEKIDLSGKGTGSDGTGETFYQSRGYIWKDTMAMIRDHWTTGVGLGAYPTVYSIYNQRDGSFSVNQAHNDYLQIVADCGIVGALAAVWFIVLVVRDMLRSLRHRDRKMSALALGAGGGVFAMLVHSLFDFNLQLPSNALLFMVLTVVISIISWDAVRRGVDEASFVETLV